jgi:hypothetical protein
VRRAGVAAALAIACTMLTAETAGAQTASAPALKAVYLFNFAKFTEWPADVLGPGASLIFCVAGDPRVTRSLEEAIGGRNIDGHPLTARTVDAEGPMESCHLLYVADPGAKRIDQLMDRVKGKPVLTISESDTFAQRGGIANLFVEDGRMRFAVNVQSLQRSKLRLSSRLLDLATIVKDAPNVSQR